MADIFIKANKEKIAKTRDKMKELSEAIKDYLIFMNNTLFTYSVRRSLEDEIERSYEFSSYYKGQLAKILNYNGEPTSYGKSAIAKEVNSKVTKASALLGRIVEEINNFENNYSASISLVKKDSSGNVLLHGNVTKTTDGIDKWTYTWETEDGKKVELSLDEMLNASWTYMGMTMNSMVQGKIFADESGSFDFTTDFQMGLLDQVNSVVDSAVVAGAEQGLSGSYFDIMAEDGIKSVVSKIDNSKGVPGLYQTITNGEVKKDAVSAYNKTQSVLKETNSNVLAGALVGTTYLGAYSLTGYINSLLSGDKTVNSNVSSTEGNIVTPTGNEGQTNNGVNSSGTGKVTDGSYTNDDNKKKEYIDEDGDLVTEVDDNDVKPVEEENEDEEGHEPGDDDPEALKDLEEKEDEEIVEEIDEEEDEEPIEEIEEDDEEIDETESVDEETETEDEGKVIEITEYTPEEVPEVKEVEIKNDVTKDYDQLAIDEYKASVEANPQIEAAKQADWIQEFDDLYRNNPEQLRQSLKEMGYSDSDIAKMVAENDDAYFFGRDCYINGKRNAEIAEMAKNFAKADGVTDYNTRFDDANSGLINQLDIDYNKDVTISDLNTKLDSAGNSYKSSYGEYSSLVSNYKDSNEKIENFKKMYGDATGWNQSQADEWNKMVDENDELYKKLMIASNTVTENEKQYLDLKQQLTTAKTNYVEGLLKNRQAEIQNISTASVNVEPLKSTQGSGDGVTLADINNLL